MKYVQVLFVAAALSGCALVGSKSSPVGHADLQDAQGKRIGTATLRQRSDNTVSVEVEVSGLAPGNHGIHIHTVGSCTAPAFTDAGGHYNPTQMKHGIENAAGPHSGDLSNLVVGADGRADYKASTARVSVVPGAISLFDADGSAIVIHAAADDQKTDPSGNSGARIACGVLKPR